MNDGASRLQRLLRLEPEFRERVWGGQRLRAAMPPMGEAWIGYERSRVAAGRYASMTVAEAAAADPAWILGSGLAARFGSRFPLLVKLLDCADWLSVQVHPDDEQARRMVGPDEFGKTEAWLFLAADEDASILAGVRPGTTAEGLARAVRGGTILEVAGELKVRAGDGIVVPAGMLHALGPGLFVYEVQESSDTTYRVYDWGRPATAGRRLHIDESCEVLRPYPVPDPVHVPLDAAGAPPGAFDVLETEYFDVDLIVAAAGEPPVALDTGGRSFHLVTAVEGEAELRAADESVRLGRYETALVAAGTGAYAVAASPGGTARLLRSAVPDVAGR